MLNRLLISRTSNIQRLVKQSYIPNYKRFLSSGVPKKPFFRQGPISWASFAMCVVVCSGSLIYFEILKDKKIQEQTTKVETTGKAGKDIILFLHI